MALGATHPNPGRLVRPVWGDPNRPAGSEFSEEQWAAVEMENPGCVVCEVRKGSQVGLVALPADQADAEMAAISAILSRGILIDEQNLHKFPYAQFASVSIEDRRVPGEVWTYKVVRSERAAQGADWIDPAMLAGATLYLGGTPTPTAVQSRAQGQNAPRPRSERFARHR